MPLLPLFLVNSQTGTGERNERIRTYHYIQASVLRLYGHAIFDIEGVAALVRRASTITLGVYLCVFFYTQLTAFYDLMSQLPQDRVTDHRVGISHQGLHHFMAGGPHNYASVFCLAACMS